jgi:hypothetical protein
MFDSTPEQTQTQFESVIAGNQEILLVSWSKHTGFASSHLDAKYNGLLRNSSQPEDHERYFEQTI